MRIMIRRFIPIFVLTILASFISSTVTVTTSAQTARPPVTVSIQAGLSLATVSPEEGSDLVGADYDFQNGFNVRASVFLPFSRLLGTQLGIGWVQKGSSITFSIPQFDTLTGRRTEDLSLDMTLRSEYLQFPLLLSLKPTSVFNILVGPVVSFPLSCGAESLGESIDCDENDFLELNTDISIMAGAGVSIPLSSSFSLSLDAVYDLGMTEIAEDSDSKNRGFMFTAGIRLPLNR